MKIRCIERDARQMSEPAVYLIPRLQRPFSRDDFEVGSAI